MDTTFLRMKWAEEAETLFASIGTDTFIAPDLDRFGLDKHEKSSFTQVLHRKGAITKCGRVRIPGPSKLTPWRYVVQWEFTGDYIMWYKWKYHR